MKTFLKVLLILILIPVVLAGGLLIFLATRSGEYDSAELIRGEVSLPAAQRYGFDPASRQMRITLDKADVYWFLGNEYGAPLDELVNEELEGTGLQLKSLGIQFHGSELTADAKLTYKNFLPLPLHAEGTLEADNTSVRIHLTRASLAGLVNLGAEKLQDLVEDYEFDYARHHPLLQNAAEVDLQENCLVLTRDYPMDWLMEEAGKNLSDYTIVLDFVHPEEVACTLPEMIAWSEGDPEPILARVDALAADPGAFPALKEDLLATAGYYAAHCYFAGEGEDLNPRLLPEITEESVKTLDKAIRAEYQSIYDARIDALAECEWDVLQRYADGRLTLTGGQLQDSNTRKKLDLATLESYEGLDRWLDVSTLRVVMATNPGDYLLKQTPKGNSVPVFILRTYSGRPVVAYQFVPKMYKVVSLHEDAYVKYMKSGSIPTMDLGESTTKR